MSIFKKIFSKKLSDESVKEEYPNRQPRVHLHPLHHVHFHADGVTSALDVANISSGGMAIFHREDSLFQVGGQVRGIISIDKDEFAIEARIRHIFGILVGCQFNHIAKQELPNDEYTRLKRAVENYFRIEVLALSLHPVSPAFLKHDERGVSHWVTDGRQNEIFAVMDEKGMVTFHLSFVGHYVEGGRGCALQAGLVHERGHHERPGHKVAAMLDLSRAPDAETLRLALSFVQNAARLPSEVRKELEEFLTDKLAPAK
jgi:hypothetical protein